MIIYTTEGKPEQMGIYACRVPCDTVVGLLNDLFLMWYQGHWYYLGSDQRYRGEVLGWIGPLQRKLASKASQRGGADGSSPGP